MGRFNLPKNLKYRGAQAESEFAKWLDQSERPYIIVDQSPASMPKHLRGAFKRPDFFVGCPSIGVIGCEVKAFGLYRGAFLFNEAEYQNLDNFARGFNIHVWLFFFPPDEPDECYFIRNCDLAALERKRMRGRTVIELKPGAAMTAVRHGEVAFEDAVFEAVRSPIRAG